MIKLKRWFNQANAKNVQKLWGNQSDWKKCGRKLLLEIIENKIGTKRPEKNVEKYSSFVVCIKNKIIDVVSTIKIENNQAPSS